MLPRFLRRLILFASTGVVAASGLPIEDFAFAFKFDTTVTVSGSSKGVQSADDLFVTLESGSLALKLVADLTEESWDAGTVFAGRRLATPEPTQDPIVWDNSPPIISFRADLNHFIFSPLAAADQPPALFAPYFYILTADASWNGAAISEMMTGSFYSTVSSDPTSWELTNLSRSATVPDRGVTAVMLLLALVGLLRFRPQR